MTADDQALIALRAAADTFIAALDRLTHRIGTGRPAVIRGGSGTR